MRFAMAVRLLEDDDAHLVFDSLCTDSKESRMGGLQWATRWRLDLLLLLFVANFFFGTLFHVILLIIV
jgi:hypothetical protein